MVKKFLRGDFVRFCIVGVGGFTVNFILLTLLYKTVHWPLFVSQLIAGEIALFHNFFLHHNWTYRDRNTTKTFRLLLIQFHLTSWFAVILTTVVVTVGVSLFKLHYVVALVLAAVLALLWNYIWSKYVIWAQSTDNLGAGREELVG